MLFFGREFVFVTVHICQALRAECVLKVDSGCVCAAPEPYPSSRVCCRTAASTGSAAAALGSSRTHNPTVHSLSTSYEHKHILSDTLLSLISHNINMSCLISNSLLCELLKVYILENLKVSLSIRHKYISTICAVWGKGTILK